MLLLTAACGDGGDEAASTTAQAATTREAATEETVPDIEGDAETGAAVWGEAGCGSCHTLAAAGSTGTTGPNLDEVAPSFEQVVEQVTNGSGGMPAFEGTLTELQILDVAAFVVESTQG